MKAEDVKKGMAVWVNEGMMKGKKGHVVVPNDGMDWVGVSFYDAFDKGHDIQGQLPAGSKTGRWIEPIRLDCES